MQIIIDILNLIKNQTEDEPHFFGLSFLILKLFRLNSPNIKKFR